MMMLLLLRVDARSFTDDAAEISAASFLSPQL